MMRQTMTIIKVSSKAILRNTFVFLELKDVLGCVHVTAKGSLLK